MRGKRKWLIVLGSMAFALLLSAVVYQGITGMQRHIAAVSVHQQEADADPAENFRTVRQQMRSMLKAQLNDIAHAPSTEAELAAMARRQLLELYTREEQETTLEGILSVQGWESPVVSVHTGSVNVLLQAETITRQESSMILDLVCRETGAMPGNVKIIPIK